MTASDVKITPEMENIIYLILYYKLHYIGKHLQENAVQKIKNGRETTLQREQITAALW